MSTVRLLVGTCKGAFILTSDGARRPWDVDGPHFGGWEIHHAKGSPVDPDRLYLAQWTEWFGQVIQRSRDGGKTWDAVGNEFVYDGALGTHLWRVQRISPSNRQTHHCHRQWRPAQSRCW